MLGRASLGSIAVSSGSRSPQSARPRRGPHGCAEPGSQASRKHSSGPGQAPHGRSQSAPAGSHRGGIQRDLCPVFGTNSASDSEMPYLKSSLTSPKYWRFTQPRYRRARAARRTRSRPRPRPLPLRTLHRPRRPPLVVRAGTQPWCWISAGCPLPLRARLRPATAERTLRRWLAPGPGWPPTELGTSVR